MQVVTKSKQKAVKKPSKKSVSAKEIDYENDPFFVKKANESKEFLEKHGFPKEALTRK